MREKQKKKPLVVGAISKSMARRIGTEPGEIRLDLSHVGHITDGHLPEIKSAGFTPTTFVQSVANSYNTVYKGSGRSIVLAVYDVPITMVAAITLEYDEDDKFWLVRTAYPVKASQVRRNRDKILWTKEPTLQ